MILWQAGIHYLLNQTILWQISQERLELVPHGFIRDELHQSGIGQRHQRSPIVVVQITEWFSQATYAFLRGENVDLLLHYVFRVVLMLCISKKSATR